MLRGIDPILSPDLLRILRAMGHGDDIVIADANFPGETMTRNLVRLDGIDAVRTLRGVLSVMPLDTFVDDPLISMQMVDDPESVPPVVVAFQKTIDDVADNPAIITPVERFAFYERARAAFAVIQTGERRLYGNIIVKKGVLQPDSA